MTAIRVKGNATDEEIAVVLTALARVTAADPDPYRQWRDIRLSAVTREGATGARDCAARRS
jgi:hypothetical protein